MPVTKKVVDPSFLRHGDLEEYFRADVGNQVVLTDYACMESYKGNSLTNLQQSLRIVAAWPERVIILKSTREIIRLQTNPRHVIEDFIDREQTTEFRYFFGQLNEVAQGNTVLGQRMQALTEFAQSHFERMHLDAAGVAEAIAQIATTFRPQQLAELRRRGPLSKETGDVIIGNMLAVAAILFRDHPETGGQLPPWDAVRRTFVFRFAIAVQLLVVRWLSQGGFERVNRQRLSNDVADMTYVAYATFFDGILSNDRKLRELNREMRFFLTNIFPSEPSAAQ